MLVDPTGIKFLGEGEWKCKERGAERWRQWRKLHIGIDAKTLHVRAICVTANNVGNAAVMLELLAQVPVQEPLLTVTGNGACDTQSVHAAVMQRNAAPITPPRQNARLRNAAIAACRRFGRKLWKNWRRSLVKTKMYCIKRIGERVMSRTFQKQVNELHIRAAILN